MKNEFVTKTESNTSEPIYEAYRRRRLEGKTRTKLVIGLSSLLAVGVLFTIGILQYDEYFALINDRVQYVDKSRIFCNQMELAIIDVLSTPLAILLTFVYIILYKRRVLLRGKFRFRNFGLPMVVGCWNKTDRLFSSFTYGLIAFNVYNIVKNSLESKDNRPKILNYMNIRDPTGFLLVTVRIIEMFLVGVRYYPVLVAYRTNTFLINLTCTIYMWIDFVENVYQYGKCESISTETFRSHKKLDRIFPLYILYKILSAIPLSIFSSFIVITLTYRTIINLIDFIIRYNSAETRSSLIRKNHDSICCLIANVDDDYEILYSKYDLDYVVRLLSKSTKRSNQPRCDELSPTRVKKYSIKYAKLIGQKCVGLVRKFFYQYIFDWDRTFRFTSRWLNMINVAIVALYYIFIYWTFRVSLFAIELQNDMPDEFYAENIVVNPYELMCSINEIFCFDQLVSYGQFELRMPKKVITITRTFRISVLCVFILPAYFAFVVCMAQIFFLIRETKTNLKQMYQGKCEFVRKASSWGKISIASSSFHFGGYLVGYLVWGYIFLYLSLLVFAFVIMFIHQFIGDHFFLYILIRLIPIMTAVMVKKIFNTLLANFAFLDRRSQNPVLNNFRAFNIFLYFNFHYDCFMGIISAFIRLVKSIVISIFMMSRVSYSFFGRHFECNDNGYSCYAGFLHMEASHTNPIIICFCSILYYKDLAEHIRRYYLKEKLNDSSAELNARTFKGVQKYNGRLSICLPSHDYHRRTSVRTYKKVIVNRWHLYLRMTLNKELIKYRKI